MNINFIMQSMFITPKQAVELFNLNIDQNVSMFFWGEILHEGQQCWGLFLIADEDTDPQYLTGDERAEPMMIRSICRSAPETTTITNLRKVAPTS